MNVSLYIGTDNNVNLMMELFEASARILAEKLEDMSSIRVPDSFPEKEKLRAYVSKIQIIKAYGILGERKVNEHRVFILRKLFQLYFGPEAIDDGVADNSTNQPTPPQDEQPADDNSGYQASYAVMEDVGVKVYRPRVTTGSLLPCLVYFHGGGWTLGSADDMEELTMNLAKGAQIIVVSVNYRMAPEHLFPAAVEDCVRVARYVLSDGEKHGIDRNKCAVAGDSAGGNLAAVTAQTLRGDQTLPRLRAQVLLYPVLQGVDFNLPSYRANHDDPYLDRAWMVSFWLWYIQGLARADVPRCIGHQHLTPADTEFISRRFDYSSLGSDQIQLNARSIPQHLQDPDTKPNLRQRVINKLMDPRASPLLTEDLTGLPDAYVVTCTQDVLHDEGVLYVNRLRKAGVKVHHEDYEALHAIFDFQDLKFVQEAMASMIAYLRTALH